jgi:serine/tyrosine/threonine adenylyltransferase
MRALLNALAPLIGAEASLSAGESLQPGWAKDASEDQLQAWRQKGQEETKEEMERVFEEISRAEYSRLMHKVRMI